MDFDIVGDSYKLGSVALSAQECINWYPSMYKSSVDEQPAKNYKSLNPTPGLESLGSISSAVGRGCIRIFNRNFGVWGNALYEIVVDQVNRTLTSSTSLGTLNTSTGKVNILSTPDVLFISDGTYSYSYSLHDGTFTELTDPDIVGFSSVAYLDSFIFGAQRDSEELIASGAGDIASWNQLDRATAEGKGDLVKAIIAKDQQLWVFGEIGVQLYYNSKEEEGFPFSERPDIFIDVGCEATHGVCLFDNTIAWVDNNHQIMNVQDYKPRMLSTEPINIYLSDKDVSDAELFWMNISGHDWLVCQFPGIDKTFVYDMDYDCWFEMRSKIDNEQRRWRINHIMRCGRLLLGQSWSDGSLYIIDPNIYDEDGTEITRVRVTKPGFVENKYVSVSNLEIFMESGVGTSNGTGSNPKLLLYVSKDGGHTYGRAREGSIGRIGEYKSRIKYRGLGTARDWTIKLVTTDPVKAVLIGASIDVYPSPELGAGPGPGRPPGS